MDQDAINLAKAIRQTESGGNFNAKGASGESGAYQWMPDTWKAHAQQALGNPNAPMTPENQNAVAYTVIKQWKDQGLNPAQISAKWNSGSESGWENKIGVNSKGVQYNVPKYVKSVTDAYQKVKQGGSVGIDPANPSAAAAIQGGMNPYPELPLLQKQEPIELDPYKAAGGASDPFPQMEVKQESLMDKVKSLPGKALDFAFPIFRDVDNLIKGKNEKTALQIAGDAGLSALWFLPFGGIARGGATALKALGAAEKVAKVGGPLIAGLGAGYAGDVAHKLSEGKEDLSALRPGLGTALGGGLGGAGIGAAKLFDRFAGQQRMFEKVAGAYDDALGATKASTKAASKFAAKAEQTPGEFLAAAGIAPETQNVNGRLIFTTGEGSKTRQLLQERTRALTELRDRALEQPLANGRLPLGSFKEARDKALQSLESGTMGTERERVLRWAQKELDTLGEQYMSDDVLKLDEMNKIKSYFQGLSKYDKDVPTDIQAAARKVANAFKTQIEDDAASIGREGIAKLNEVIAEHMKFIDKGGILDKLNGQVVKGGRLGIHAAELAGGIAGSGISRALGGGVIGELAGVAGGFKAGNLVAQWLQKLSVGGPIARAILGRMAKEEPEAVIQFLRQLGIEGAPSIAPNVVPQAGQGFTRALDYSPGSLLKRALDTRVQQRVPR